MLGVLSQSLPTVAWILAGRVAKIRGLLTEVDARNALTFVKWVTLPAVWLQTFNRVPTDLESLAGLLLVAVACAALTGAAAWFLAFQGKPAKDRAWLTGSSLGGDIGVATLPIIGSFYGVQGLWAAGVLELVNGIVASAGTFLLLGSAGTAFPESYAHEDGGEYSGEWDRLKKQGLGVYQYPGGARYEGEWRNNLKDGRGVYYFAKGGVYEGEWSAGERDGIGVHTYSSGKVKAGRWGGGRLQAPLAVWQCSGAVEGAIEAADAARSLQFGSASPLKALQQAASQPGLWALAAGMALSVTETPLPAWADVVTRQLSSIHLYLALIALGADWTMPVWGGGLQDHDAWLAVCCRCAPPLLLVSVASTLVVADWWRRLLACVATCLLAPLPPSAAEYAVRFRLVGPQAAAALRHAQSAACVALMLAVGAVGAGAPGAVPGVTLVLGTGLLALGTGLRGRAVPGARVKMTLDLRTQPAAEVDAGRAAAASGQPISAPRSGFPPLTDPGSSSSSPAGGAPSSSQDDASQEAPGQPDDGPSPAQGSGAPAATRRASTHALQQPWRGWFAHMPRSRRDGPRAGSQGFWRGSLPSRPVDVWRLSGVAALQQNARLLAGRRAVSAAITQVASSAWTHRHSPCVR